MPQDGSNNYQYPPGTRGTPDQTIESEAYNTFLDDLTVNDLNWPRPVHRGGSGANNARDAMINLGGEIAAQVVTNYNSFQFRPGSFFSAPGATGAPTPGGYFMGIAFWLDTGNMFLEATALASGNATIPPAKYIREMLGSVWGNWLLSDTRATIADTAKVAKAGDTMTGDLNVNANVGVQLALGVGGTISTSSGRVVSSNASNPGFTAWNGSSGRGMFNVGGVLAFGPADVAGNLTSSVVSISAAGAMSIASTLSVAGQASFAVPARFVQAAGTGAGFFVDTATAASRFFVGGDASADILRVYSSLTTTNLLVLSAASTASIVLTGSGSVNLGTGFLGRAGTTGGYNAFVNNIYYTGAAQQAWIDNVNIGNYTLTSDYRTKKDVADLPTMWDTVKLLRPIKYTHQNFSPPAHRNGADDTKTPTPMVTGDDVERWGFIAHELQETLIETAATGVKDSPDHIQSPNPFTLIAALTKALQEAMARIEALEAA